MPQIDLDGPQPWQQRAELPDELTLIDQPDLAIYRGRQEQARVLLGSALSGAALLLAADLLARFAVAPAELPLGVVTALIGAPFLIWLLSRRRDALAG